MVLAFDDWPTSLSMSKYWVIRIRFITSCGDVPGTVFWNSSTDSRSPSTIACRWSATPLPERAFASASASAAFTCMIFSASPFSLAAARIRCAALISFMASLTLASGSMSVTRVLTMP